VRDARCSPISLEPLVQEDPEEIWLRDVYQPTL